MLSQDPVIMMSLGTACGAALAAFRESFRPGRFGRAVTLAGISAAILVGVATARMLA